MLGRRYSPSFLQGTRPRFASDTLMSLRAIPSSSLGYLVLRRGISIPLRICGSGVRGIPPVRWVAWWFSMCAPCLANCGGGGLSRFSVLLGGWVFCVRGGEGCRGLVCCMVAGVLRVGRGRLSPFSLLRGGWMFGLVRRVFRKRPQGVTRTLSAAKQGGAERPGDGCPCVGAEETYGVLASTHTQ